MHDSECNLCLFDVLKLKCHQEGKTDILTKRHQIRMLRELSLIIYSCEIYLQTYRHDMTYSVLKVPLNPNEPTNVRELSRVVLFVL